MNTIKDVMRPRQRFELLCLLLVAACGSSHVRMVNPDTTGSGLYACDQNACRPSDVDDPAMFNQSGTQFVRLPRECKGRVNEVFVQNANSSAPQVYVRCAPAEASLDTMGAPAASATPSAAPTVIDAPGTPLPEMGADQ